MEAANRHKITCKSRLTAVSNKLSILTPIDGKHQLEIYIDQFREKLKQYDDAQSSVELYADETDLDRLVIESEEWRDSKLEILARAKESLEQLTAEINSSVSAKCSHQSPSSAPTPTLPVNCSSSDYYCAGCLLCLCIIDLSMFSESHITADRRAGG